MSNQINYMSIAIEEAMKAKNKQEVPVGAVIVDDKGEVIAKAHNLVELNNNSTCHAEKLAIEFAEKFKNAGAVILEMPVHQKKSNNNTKHHNHH